MGSYVPDRASALFSSSPLAVGTMSAVTVMVRSSPTARSKSAHVSVRPAGSHSAPVARASVTCSGSASVTRTSRATAGPSLRTTRSHSTRCPATGVSVRWRFVNDTSAEEPSGVVVVAVSLSVTGSGVPLLMRPVLTISPAAAASTVPTTSILADAPGANESAEHRTLRPSTEQSRPPSSTTLASVSSSGRVSPITAGSAAEGPWLVMVSRQVRGAPACGFSVRTRLSRARSADETN